VNPIPTMLVGLPCAEVQVGELAALLVQLRRNVTDLSDRVDDRLVMLAMNGGHDRRPFQALPQARNHRAQEWRQGVEFASVHAQAVERAPANARSHSAR